MPNDTLSRNRRDMWCVIGWAVWVLVMFGLLVFAGACLGVS